MAERLCLDVNLELIRVALSYALSREKLAFIQSLVPNARRIRPYLDLAKLLSREYTGLATLFVTLDRTSARFGEQWQSLSTPSWTGSRVVGTDLRYPLGSLPRSRWKQARKKPSAATSLNSRAIVDRRSPELSLELGPSDPDPDRCFFALSSLLAHSRRSVSRGHPLWIRSLLADIDRLPATFHPCSNHRAIDSESFHAYPNLEVPSRSHQVVSPSHWSGYSFDLTTAHCSDACLHQLHRNWNDTLHRIVD